METPTIEPKWNLYAHRLHDYGEQAWATTAQPTGQFDKLIMPDAEGVMQEPAPTGWNWYAIHWPVNPHFTGENMILDMLNERLRGHAVGNPAVSASV